MAGKMVYFFGEGDTKDKYLLGGKGANLGEMTKIGLPVPPGFTITTRVCMEAVRTKKWPAGLEKQVDENIRKLEHKMGKKFGDNENPLLVSVRSGAASSMPGMMDTILNLGMNDNAVQGLMKRTKNERFAWDAYRRFLQMFGDVVLEVDHDKFEHILNERKHGRMDTELSAGELRDLVAAYKWLIKSEKGKDFPQDPKEQLKLSIDAVFRSWNNDRARTYRNLNNIPHDLGTAVNVQTMVFGNMGEDSGTGVAFTRDPATGENKFYGEFLMNAQGEDVVAGIRTPHPISDLSKSDRKAYTQLVQIREKLEKHYKDMQDLEFTIEKGKLYMLQTRNGKRTAQAAVRMAVEMVKEGLNTKDEALLKVDPASLDQLLHPAFDTKALKAATPITKGLNAGPGAAVGKVVFSAKEAEDVAAKGEKVILVRIETSPDDIKGMHVANGILTSLGGRTSHAAVVARQMGKCCVAGAGDVRINYQERLFTAGGVTVRAGDVISLDGNTGCVYTGSIATVEAGLTGDFGTIMKWSDEARKLGVWTNAQSPKDAQVAVKFGAEGIGLARTERMFYDGDRITYMRKMIMADTVDERKKALKDLEPFQREDFEGLFSVLNGKPVTIRLLDPPLHEFLPFEAHEQQKMAKALNVPVEKVRAKVEDLKEFNPMLGHRGVRLGITNPEISEVQVRAIIEAAMNVKKKGIKVKPKIMIPQVGHVNELKILVDLVHRVAAEVFAERKESIPYDVGTMIEVPRACVTADQLATVAQFFSFGTNDLTQAGAAFSRDDAGKFLKVYADLNIYDQDPFAVLDQEGIGELVRLGVVGGRKTNPKLEIGICGEHGGDPKTIKFCHKIGLTYVSCSPFRVPIARLAAAHAAIEERQKHKKALRKAAKVKKHHAKPAKAKRAKARSAKPKGKKR